MIDRPQIHGHHQWRKTCRASDLYQPGFAVAAGRRGFMIEETLEEVAEKEYELRAFPLAHRTKRGLYVEGLHSGNVGALE
jgi:hypothetical protein